MNDRDSKLTLFGWREWVELPELGLQHLKAKIDTGARTSALHAFDVEHYLDGGQKRVRFRVQPRQRDDDTVIDCVADVIDKRNIKNSGGQETRRWVIETPIRVGNVEWPIEITLTARHDMAFRMLIGRQAMRGIATVDPSRSYLASGSRRKH